MMNCKMYIAISNKNIQPLHIINYPAKKPETPYSDNGFNFFSQKKTLVLKFHT